MNRRATAARVTVEWPTGEAHQRVVDLTEQAHVGRALSCALRLPHPTVSARHAVLRRGRSGELELTDSGSRFGTFIDTERVPEAVWRPVQADDDVWLGDIRLRFEWVDAPPPADATQSLAVTRALRQLGRELEVRLRAPNGTATAYRVPAELPSRLDDRDLPADAWPTLAEELPFDLVEGVAGIAVVTASGLLLNIEEGPQVVEGVTIEAVPSQGDALLSSVLPAPSEEPPSFDGDGTTDAAPDAPEEADGDKEEGEVAVAADGLNVEPAAAPASGDRPVADGWVERAAVVIGVVSVAVALLLLWWILA